MSLKQLSILIFVCWLALIPFAAGAADDDIAKFPRCEFCGMDRARFAFSRMLLTFKDGGEIGTCSIRCVSEALTTHAGREVTGVFVGDAPSRKLIDAKTATWVINPDKPGVMTRRAKWAFQNKAEAEDYIKGNGGFLAVFDEALKASNDDLSADLQMMRERRERMLQQRQQQQPPEQPKQ